VSRLWCGRRGVGCIAANTPHLVFDEVERRSQIPSSALCGRPSGTLNLWA
jgi:hypothetical protein